MLFNRYYVTTAIPYVNARPHVGHAVLLIYADVLARYHRQRGDDTWALTGTDDNSLTNVLAAEAEGVPVAELVDRNAASFRALRGPLGLSFDDFIRTSGNPKHQAGAERLWLDCNSADDVYKRYYQGLYCVRCERFYAEDELIDQGCCPMHYRPVEMVAEENYFFRLRRYAPQLVTLIETGRMRIVPETRRNEVLRFIQAGLQDFSISRSQARARGWGIPVPSDPTQVMYVWFDALCNYISALGFAEDGPLYRRYWRENPHRVHVIGKDLLRFHAVYWPAMLLSAGQPTPTTIYAHEFFTVNGQRISKSLGNAIDPTAIVERMGTDGLRYSLLRELPRTEDTDLTMERLLARYDTDLANGLGNLLQRTVSMLRRYRGGVVPAPGTALPRTGELAALAQRLPTRLERDLDAFDFRAALGAIWELVARANRFVEEAAPWTLAKHELLDEAAAARPLDGVLYALAECLRLLAYHLTPFLPATADAIRRQLGGVSMGGPAWGGLAVGTRVAAPQPLFPRVNSATPTLG